MLQCLRKEQVLWVEQTLAGMTMEECVGHLICPEDRNYTPEQWSEIVKEIPVGSVFFGPGDRKRYRACLEAIQSSSGIPVLVASDLEQGCGSMVEGCTRFPFPMAWGACNDPELMLQMGRAMAQEAREIGIHWTFSPVVDLNINSQSPVVNVRSIGDDANHVSVLLDALIRGMQQDGLLAGCAKHFPGDGSDDRDGHLCTTVNRLSRQQWWETYGRVWETAINAGVMSIMSGQISFPAYEEHDDSAESMPATLSSKLQEDLLRGELGFEGVIVSDAGPMIGMSSRIPSSELAVQNILSGSDVYLFANPRKDFHRLMKALRNGRLSMERVRQSARRVLELKARLGLNESVFGQAVTPEAVEHNQQLADQIAERSITVIRKDGNIPANLKPGSKLLTVTLKYPEPKGFLPDELDIVDSELTQRGYVVDHLLNPTHREILAKIREYDKVFFNIYIMPHSRPGTIRITGELVLAFWRAFWVDHPKAVFTSFGSPYHLYELPHLPNMVLAYGPTESAQKAAVKVWLGDIQAEGVCPVELELGKRSYVGTGENV